MSSQESTETASVKRVTESRSPLSIIGALAGTSQGGSKSFLITYGSTGISVLGLGRLLMALRMKVPLSTT